MSADREAELNRRRERLARQLRENLKRRKAAKPSQKPLAPPEGKSDGSH